MSPVSTEFSFDQSFVFVVSFLFCSALFLLRNKLLPKGSQLPPPPSPPGLPFLGNLLQIGSLPHRSLAALSEKYGPLLLIRMGQVPTLLVSSPDTFKEITRAHDLVFSDRPSLKAPSILMYNSMDVGFVRFGDYWRQAKKLCNLHLLSAAKVRANQHIREELVASMIEKISQSASATSSAKSPGKVIDMREMVGSYIIDLVCRSVSGKRLLEDGRNKRAQLLIEDSAVIFSKIFVGDYFPALGWVDEVSGLSRSTKSLLRRWDAFFDELIEENLDRSKKEKSFLHELLTHLDQPEEEIGLTNDQIKGILMDMFCASTDTTQVAIEWSLAELVQSPTAMKRLQDEVRGMATAGADGLSMIKSNELENMSYLKAVVKEVLRLHPPAPLLLPRASTEDCELQGYHIQKGTRVIINAWAICRDPGYWSEPDAFRPERFLDSDVDYNGNDFQFIPFGSGRRFCPGMPFATASVEIALANLVQRFDWEIPDAPEQPFDATEAPGLTMRLKNGLRLVAKPWQP